MTYFVQDNSFENAPYNTVVGHVVRASAGCIMIILCPTSPHGNTLLLWVNLNQLKLWQKPFSTKTEAKNVLGKYVPTMIYHNHGRYRVLKIKDSSIKTYSCENINIGKRKYHRTIPLNHCTFGPLARYAKLRVAYAPGMPGTFSPPPGISDPDMHHGTCVTHVSWCMPGSLTSGFLWSRRRGETFPATCNFTYLVRGPRHGTLQLDIACGVAMTRVGFQSDIYLTKDITHMALTCELWNICCQDFFFLIWTKRQEVFFISYQFSNQSVLINVWCKCTW